MVTKWLLGRKKSGSDSRKHTGGVNWTLLVGIIFVVFFVGLAFVGPAIAPRDPLEVNQIIKLQGRWETPPFPGFMAPEFPLGSDDLGRDILSRLLWAVRPTLIMVTVVAAVRLVLGVLIGLASGWLTGRLGRVLEVITTGALSVPILIVALCVIAAVGVEIGIWAFILGLGITGWAETARLVHEQTRDIKRQLYVEAAQALGASDPQILFRHVLRHIVPRVWLFFSFEISSTLMATAGLGFLGYYIGGDVWIEVEDYIAARISGSPELGQMLASSVATESVLQIYFEPWGLVAVGSVIFIAVLGFHLLGEGLLRRVSLLERTGRQSLFSRMADTVGAWIEERIVSQIPERVRKRAVLIFVLGFSILVLAGSLVWWWGEGVGSVEDSKTTLEVPGGHLWAADRHDPYGTKWTESVGPSSPEVRRFFRDMAGLVGGPAVSADGTLYLGSRGGSLYALDPNGALLWEDHLPAPCIGAPALSAEGDVYVADEEGGLSAFTPGGKLRWRFYFEGAKTSTAGPIVGPDGTIYYNTGSKVQAVSPQGDRLWQAQAYPYQLRFSPLRLDPTEELLYWEDLAFDLQDGSQLDFEIAPATHQEYIVGAGGGNYIVAASSILSWRQTVLGPEIVGGASWKADITVVLPDDIGITPEETVWVFYGDSWLGHMRASSRLIWVDMEGRILNEVSGVVYPPSFVIGIDGDSKLMLCGMDSEMESQCSSHLPKVEEPIWQLNLGEAGEVVGGALVPGRLYVAMSNGDLLVLGDPENIEDIKPVTVEIAMSMEEEAGTNSGPGESSWPTEHTTPTPTPTEGDSDLTSTISGIELTEYVVQPGDWVWKIARDQSVDPRAIIRLNGLTAPYILHPGDVLRMPVGEDVLLVGKIEYVVQPGDWVYEIARNYGVDPQQIIEANDLEPPYLIHPGDVLKIPIP
jgi:ABC-type dipeptide/oligopeptide/nickel transport system permease subunit/LysM repeat protein